MCGIVGYIGAKDSVPIIIESLASLEYRGYDSAGIAVIDADGVLTGSKAEGKLARLAERLQNGGAIHGTTGLGHTRWATHGRPSDANAHPHMDCSGRFAVVHNGIIENYAALRERLLGEGHIFKSETDTEVLAHLIEANYNGDLTTAIRHSLAQVRGAFALGVISSEDPGRLVFARNGASPLIVGLANDEMYVASDIPALLKYTREMLIVEEGEMVDVVCDGYTLTAFDGTPVARTPKHIAWDVTSAQKGNFKHFMLKEIFEEPNVIKETLAGRIDESGDVQLAAEINLDESLLRAMTKISITGCGTAYNAGMVGMYLMRALCKLPVEMELASEFRYGDRAMDPRTLTIAMSQSGETADTIEAVKIAKEVGAPILAISNVVGSHLTRLADGTLLTRGGPEISVAATKTYVSQSIAATLFAVYLARLRRTAEPELLRRIAKGTKLLSEAINVVLETDAAIEAVAQRLLGARSALFLGRYVNVPTALEGALKLKEISYIHAEGYAAGEMKHGPIALLDPQTPVIGIVTEGRVREKMLSNLAEAKARQAPIILVANKGDDEAAAIADHVLWVPKVEELLSPIVNVIPLQLLAYHIADLGGKDVDQPRNLAKTVTVE
jgi:glucosamine--fructose-6-phosphate aminotransferase (isomerizing)